MMRFVSYGCVHCFFDLYEYQMDLCNELCLSGRLAVLCGKNFNFGLYMQIVQINLFISAMLIGAIYFYYFIPLSLTLPRGHKVSAKLNLLASFSNTLFI